MKIKANQYYKLQINIHGRTIDYEGRILNIKPPYFYLRTKEDCKIELKLKDIINFKQIEPPKKEIPKIIIRKKRVPKEQLKKSIEPEF